MQVEYKGESILIKIFDGSNVINVKDGRVFGKVEKDGTQWVYKFVANGKIYGKTKREAIQNYFDWKNKIIIVCPVCSKCFKKEDSVIYNGLDTCKEHGNKNHMMSH